MEKVHEVGPLRMTVAAPDALERVVSATTYVSVDAKSPEEFEELVGALGGPAGFEFEHAYSGTWQARAGDDGFVVLIRVRLSTPDSPPAPELIAKLRAAQADVDSALERTL